MLAFKAMDINIIKSSITPETVERVIRMFFLISFDNLFLRILFINIAIAKGITIRIIKFFIKRFIEKYCAPLKKSERPNGKRNIHAINV